MRRVVLDTNVLVSALLFPGPAQHLWGLVRKEVVVPLVSSEIMKEYVSVLTYPKFRLSENEIAYLIQEEILPFASPVHVAKVPAIIHQDPSDDKFLACAVSGRAEAIVSGDKHLLTLKIHEDIPIQNLRDFFAGFIDRVQETGRKYGKKLGLHTEKDVLEFLRK